MELLNQSADVGVVELDNTAREIGHVPTFSFRGQVVAETFH